MGYVIVFEVWTDMVSIRLVVRVAASSHDSCTIVVAVLILPSSS